MLVNATRAVAVARGAWGAVLLAAPARAARLLGAPPLTRRERAVARLLGLRQLGQAGVTGARPDPHRAAGGAVVDGLHATSMLALAAARPGRAGVTLRSAGVAASWGLIGAWSARRDSATPGRRPSARTWRPRP